VLRVGPDLRVSALLDARWRVHKVQARLLCRWTSWHCVRTACRSDKSRLLCIGPCISCISSFAAIVWSAAGLVFEGQRSVCVGIGRVNAESVRNSFHTSKCPTGSSARLIVDGGNCSACRPLLCTIKVLWKLQLLAQRIFHLWKFLRISIGFPAH